MVPDTSLRLERPSAALAASFGAMRDACLAENDDPWADRGALAHTDPIAYAAMLHDWSVGENVPEGWVPADTFWIVEGDEVVGECDVRHPLTEQLRRVGGHVGYVVHPAYRNKGVATFALRECLRVLAAKGETDALVTCAASNAASIRVIEKCGGQRSEDSTGGRRCYMIPLDNSEMG